MNTKLCLQLCTRKAICGLSLATLLTLPAMAWLLGRSTPTAAQSTSPLVVRYNGPGNGQDYARKVVVDRNGNFYVTGHTWVSSDDADYATVKYAPNGKQLWVRHYNGPTKSFDFANDLALDRNGNVYVTGRSYVSGTKSEYATVKYNTNGNLLWVKRYSGQTNLYDEAIDVAVDRNANVYVTGYSFGSSTEQDYATVKYDTNGKQLWVRRYNGPSNDNDNPTDIAADRNGNVYVTGASERADGSSEYATLKYSPSGNLLWIRRYSGSGIGAATARDVAVDSEGHVYVTGFAGGVGFDYATLKYAANGNLLWVKHYNGPDNSTDYSTDFAYDLALDANGNVYVTGASTGASRYFGYETLNYDANGNLLWSRHYNAGKGDDYANSLGVDTSGNVYVTGASPQTFGTSNNDYSTLKYDSNGNLLWVRRYNGPGNYDDSGRHLAVDRGNVYVTGESGGANTEYDYATIKYDTNGN